MSKASKYQLTITDGDGTVLDKFAVDGYDLTNPLAPRALGERVAEGMGGDAVEECAALPEPL